MANNDQDMNKMDPNDPQNRRPQQPPRSGRPRGSRKPPDGGEFKWRKASRTSIMWIIILISSIFLIQILSSGKEEEILVEYPQYREWLTGQKIQNAVIMEKEFHGKLTEKMQIFKDGRSIDVERFYLIIPLINDNTLKEWDDYGVKVDFRQKAVQWTTYLFQILPWILFIGIWIYFIRRMQGVGNKGMFNFGKSKARLWTSDRPQITFQNVAGCVEAKEELEEIIEFLKSPAKFSKLGGRIPKGALLLGPPGTGKTLLAKAVAGEAGVPFFSISGADFVEMFVGVGASRVRDLFEQGKRSAPCIIFIDEIDAVGRHRGAGLGGGHDEREQTLNQLLVEMDGFDENANVIILAATNRPDVLDNALLRPGRFDRQIVVDIPDVKGREGILRVHTKKIPLDKNVDLSILAKSTPGLVGADLANLANEAALLAARKNKKSVSMEDFEEAKDKVMMGVERKSLTISKKEREITAFHESGHALVAFYTEEADPVHKVTIIPRGRALGLTHQLPMDERHNYSRAYIDGVLNVLMGGRAAEKLKFDELTTGAGNDIERATELARKMVCEWGMSDKIGPLTFGKKKEEIFLGRDFATQRDFSEDTSRIIDLEIRRIVEAAESRALQIIKEHEKKLVQLAKALLEYEVLDGNEIQLLIEGKKLPKRKNNSLVYTNKNSEKTSLKARIKSSTTRTRTRQPRKGGDNTQRDATPQKDKE